MARQIHFYQGFIAPSALPISFAALIRLSSGRPPARQMACVRRNSRLAPEVAVEVKGQLRFEPDFTSALGSMVSSTQRGIRGDNAVQDAQRPRAKMTIVIYDISASRDSRQIDERSRLPTWPSPSDYQCPFTRMGGVHTKNSRTPLNFQIVIIQRADFRTAHRPPPE